MTYTPGQELGAKMQHCIKNCLDCASICTETARHCLQMGGKHAEAGHIGLLLDCAEICRTSAGFMLRNSPLHPQTCGVCAQVCERCATSCEQVDPSDQMMQECARLCRECAASCREMAGGGHAGGAH